MNYSGNSLNCYYCNYSSLLRAGLHERLFAQLDGRHSVAWYHWARSSWVSAPSRSICMTLCSFIGTRERREEMNPRWFTRAEKKNTTRGNETNRQSQTKGIRTTMSSAVLEHWCCRETADMARTVQLAI